MKYDVSNLGIKNLNDPRIGKRIFLSKWYKDFYPHANGIIEDQKNENYFIDLVNGHASDVIYLMYNHDTGLTKIGITKQHPLQRIKHIRSQSGCKIDFVFWLQLEVGYDEPSIIIEQRLHFFFKKKRVQGEWFDLCIKDVISLINLFYSTIEGWDFRDFSRDVLPHYKRIS